MQMFGRGDFAGAAEAWQQQALGAPPGEADALRVSAADAWLLANEPGRAEQLLGWIERDRLAAADRSRLDLVLADLALRKNRPDEADALLRRAAPGLPLASQDRLQELQRSAAAALSNPASRSIARAAALVDELGFYDPVRTVEILRVLETTRSTELELRAANPRAERQLTGWLDLALTVRRNLVVPDGVQEAIAAWKARNPVHRLSEEQALDTWLSYRQTFGVRGRSAALLPTDGRLRAAGEAVRDGLMMAYLDQPGGGDLVLLSTDDDPQSAIAAYFGALDQAAERVIGPLQRESVEALLQLAGLNTPVVALNELPPGFQPPPGLVGSVTGLSLSQEAEAAAVARHAAANGLLRAMVLAPESEWGERMAASFEDEFLRLGGQIVAATRYLESENDHSAVLERALQIDDSKARQQRLENILQMPVEFEPTRRDDLDLIFMPASPTQAKLLRPQLRFLDAGDIPAYATGRVYAGEPDPSRNQDLDGVRLPLTPWQLRHARPGDAPELASLRGGALGALFAVGQDAWNLLPWLGLMRKDPDFRFPGQSGEYRMAANGSLLREPAFAVFEDGVPRALPPPPPLLATDAPPGPATP